MATLQAHRDAWIHEPEVQARQARDVALAQQALGVVIRPRAAPGGQSVRANEYELVLSSDHGADLRAQFARLPDTCQIRLAPDSQQVSFRLSIARVGTRHWTRRQSVAFVLLSALLVALVACVVLRVR